MRVYNSDLHVYVDIYLYKYAFIGIVKAEPHLPGGKLR